MAQKFRKGLAVWFCLTVSHAVVGRWWLELEEQNARQMGVTWHLSSFSFRASPYDLSTRASLSFLVTWRLGSQSENPIRAR